MGEAGPEGILPLTRGKGGKLGVYALGGDSKPVMVRPNFTINSSDAEIENRTKDSGDLEFTVRGIVRDEKSSQRGAALMSSNYGVRAKSALR